MDDLDLVEITFSIRATDKVDKCEFNSLVLRMEALRNFIENEGKITDLDIKVHNTNVMRMQEILEHFKIHLIEGED